MPARPRFRFIAFASAIVLITGTGTVFQRSESRALRLELQEAKRAAAEIARLRIENERLQSQQIPAAELDRLRADHAALSRLRSELNELKKRAGKS